MTQTNMCLQTLFKIYSFTTINMNYINKKKGKYFYCPLFNIFNKIENYVNLTLTVPVV